jgi:ABC-type polysaccharide/polyol phosphate transport system ATPase subunit
VVSVQHCIELDGVWKRYDLGRARRLRYLVRDWLEPGARRAGMAASRDFWALREVTLDVPQGDSLAIIGNNGAGKSTMLRLVAGVTYPTRGVVKVAGRVGALVDVGAGMHPDLTGLENIYLYGAILGLSRREIKERFDSIVDFSELSAFLDVPLKRYSSGMKVRLGFSVAAFLDPDILLIDEVLAVGDMAFQRKCLERIETLQRHGTTILYVSHDLVSSERVCRRAAWISEGRLVAVGDSAEVIADYRRAVQQSFLEAAQGPVKANGALLVDGVELTDRAGVPRHEFRPGEDVVVGVHYRSDADSGIDSVGFAIRVVDSAGRTLVAARSAARALRRHRGHGTVRCTLKRIPFAPSTYQVWGQVLRFPDHREEVPWQPIASFVVVDPTADARWLPTVVHRSEVPLLTLPVRWAFNGKTGPTAQGALQSTTDELAEREQPQVPAAYHDLVRPDAAEPAELPALGTDPAAEHRGGAAARLPWLAAVCLLGMTIGFVFAVIF